MLREIVIYPDDRLREPCETIFDFGQSLKQLIRDLEDTMYHLGGIGISAPQIGENVKLFILDDFFFGAKKKLIYINPHIIHKSVEKNIEEEGCLSFPGIFLKVERPQAVIIRYQDEGGLWHEELIQGFQARAVQHEMDHLQSTLFLDHVGSLKRSMVEKKMRKRNKR